MEQNTNTDELFEEAKVLMNIGDRIEIKSRLEYESHLHKVAICEMLRKLLTDSLEWPLIVQFEARMNIGEHCGIAGIKTSSITCERPEYERRKEAFEL